MARAWFGSQLELPILNREFRSEPHRWQVLLLLPGAFQSNAECGIEAKFQVSPSFQNQHVEFAGQGYTSTNGAGVQLDRV